MTTPLAPRPVEAVPAPLVQGLKTIMPSVARLLPEDCPLDRFRAATWLHLQQSDRLQGAVPASLLECVVRAATDGLLPGSECFFLGFRNKRGQTVAEYVQHYQGVIRILERTGKLARAFAHPVYAGDEFHGDRFADRPRHISHLELGTEPGPIRFYVAAVILLSGVCHWDIVSLAYIESVRQNAPGGEQEAWLKHPVEQSKKTALKYVAKYIRLTPAAQEALAPAPPPPLDAADIQDTIAEVWGEPPAVPEEPPVPAVEAAP